jgi:hypothetical protein
MKKPLGGRAFWVHPLWFRYNPSSSAGLCQPEPFFTPLAGFVDPAVNSFALRRLRMLTRRKLLNTALKTSAGLVLSPGIFNLAEAESPLTLKRGVSSSVSIPRNFTGLGYEMSSVAARGLLSSTNGPYVELVKGLGSEGVVRAGGIVANFTRYERNGTIMTDRQNTVITRESLEQFSGFLKATGWSVIWSLNFAQGTVDEAVDEARAVASVLGSRLLAVELGNEVDAYQKPFRNPPYTYEVFRKEYDEWHTAIVNAVPGLPFAAPDTAADVDWVERMAKDANGKVQLLTTHYRGAQSHGTVEQLLHPDPRLIGNLERLRTAWRESRIPWRMCETNSFFGGGRPGVSDTFVAALWTLDYMLLLASYGCSGVNIETGVNQLGFISSYSPIQDDGNHRNSAGAPYYGMLTFTLARQRCTELYPLEVPDSLHDLSAYVLGAAGKVRSVVVVNRGVSDARVSVAALGLNRQLNAIRLQAPSASSTSGITLAGSEVDANGKWSPGTIEHTASSDVSVPGMSAVVLRD